MHTLRELHSLLVIRLLALHPDQIRIRSISISPHNRALRTTLVPEVTLPGPRGIPIKEHLLSQQLRRNRARVEVVLALGLLLVLREETALAGLGEGSLDSIVKEHEAGLREPLVFDRLELITVSTLSLSGTEEVGERLQVRVGDTEDKRMIASIDGRGDESGSLGIGTGNSDKISAHHISLSADRDKTVDVFTNRDQDLASHMAALLGTGGLVLDVNSGGTALDKEAGELEDGGDTTVTGVGIGDDRAEVVNVREGGALGFGGGKTVLALLAVVEELSLEEVLDLVGDRVLRREVRSSRGGILV